MKCSLWHGTCASKDNASNVAYEAFRQKAFTLRLRPFQKDFTNNLDILIFLGFYFVDLNIDQIPKDSCQLYSKTDIRNKDTTYTGVYSNKDVVLMS